MNNPYENERECPNCGSSEEELMTTDGKIGCTNCIETCPFCDESFDPYDLIFVEREVSIGGSDWKKTKVCCECNGSGEWTENIRLPFDLLETLF